jgi:DNA-binding response OmpR family regulator
MAKILIADDERDIRELIGFTLRFASHEVITAKDGEEALRMAEQEKPDLVLLDVRMPKMTGYETCRQLKMDPELKNIPVVFISAKGQESEIQAGLNAGAVEYVLKPFAPNDLAARVNEILARADNDGQE